MKTQRVSILLSVALGLAACSANPLAVKSDSSQTLLLRVGQELDLTVATVGPGEYQSPTISGSSLTFLGSSDVGPNTPGGPRQLFRFKGVSAGQAVFVLTHSGIDATITDTVMVR